MKTCKTLALSMAVLTLGGCQGFNSLFGANDRAAPQALEADSYFAQLINDGRRHLSANRPGSAVTAFRRASYHPDYAGEAYNGMAVAYDMMGRYDLAERFFVAAMEAAPADGRFARNFARFEDMMQARNGTGRPEVQMASSERLDVAIDLGDLDGIEQLTSPILAIDLPQRMERVSPGEVRIASRDDWGSRLSSADTLPEAVVHVGPPQGRPAGIFPRRADASDPQYPVRIALAEVPGEMAPAGRPQRPTPVQTRFRNDEGEPAIRVSGELLRHSRQEYPVRITFDPN